MRTLDMVYFRKLRNKINKKLRFIDAEHSTMQIEQYRWLYGALGAVPAEVMFICESPSIAGVKKAHIQTIDGGPPDVEAQWWGGPNDFAAKRFRPVLCKFGFKSNGVRGRGGWNCYITNVIKEASVVKDLKSQSLCEKHEQARSWASILRWEIDYVMPKHVFCVGGKSQNAIRMLQREGLIKPFKLNCIWHYSARGSHEKVITKMTEGIRKVIPE